LNLTFVAVGNLVWFLEWRLAGYCVRSRAVFVGLVRMTCMLYVCMCISMYVCVFLYVCMFVCIVSLSSDIYTCVYTYIHTYSHTYICLPFCLRYKLIRSRHLRTHIYTYIHMHTHTYAYPFVFDTRGSGPVDVSPLEIRLLTISNR
jgi:hypothetical protein